MTTDVDRTDTTLAIPEEQSGKSVQAARWNELFNLAKLISNTEVVPEVLRGRPDAIFAVMARAEEIGITPLVGVQEIAIVKGKTSPSAMLMRSMIKEAGHILQWRRTDREAAVLYGRRRDDGTEYEATFTIQDAKDQKLTGKGNYETMPKAMLMARATSLLARALFADVVLGMAYTPEELGQVGPYSAIDLEYDPDQDRHLLVDADTGEIVDDGRLSAAEVAVRQADADDQLDRDLLHEAAIGAVADALDEDRMDRQWVQDARAEEDREDTPLIEGQFDTDEPRG